MIPRMELYTKNGRPLQLHGEKVFSRSGILVGRIKHERVFGPDGHYVATVVGDRLVYRSAHKAQMGTPFTSADRVGILRMNHTEAAIVGDEPNIPD